MFFIHRLLYILRVISPLESIAGQRVGVVRPQLGVHNVRQSRSFQGFAGFPKPKKWFATFFENNQIGCEPIPQMPMISSFLKGSEKMG